MDKLVKILRVVLVLFIFLWVVIWLTGRAITKAPNSRNRIEASLVSLYKAPGEVKQYIKSFWGNDHLEKTIDHIEDIHQIGMLQNLENLYDSVFLLHYRYLGDKSGVVVLQNIKNGKIAYSWDIPLDDIMQDNDALRKELSKRYLEGSAAIDHSLLISKSISAINISAPTITSDSSLLFHTINGYLYKIDRNSELVWKSDNIVHHSIELDEVENIWTCSIDIDNKTANTCNFRDDAILCLEPDGNVKHFISLTEIFSNNNLFENTIVSLPISEWFFGLDPYHLNDIQPVKSDGKYWKKGDIFLSLRSLNMAVLYRPDSDSIVWLKQGPWRMQHDINVVNDSVISIFNNNGLSLEVLDFSSNITYYNFANNQTQTIGEDIFTSRYEGRQTQIFNGDIIIEETDNSTYLIFDSTGKLRCRFYIPYYSDFSNAQYPCWAKIYFKANN